VIRATIAGIESFVSIMHRGEIYYISFSSNYSLSDTIMSSTLFAGKASMDIRRRGQEELVRIIFACLLLLA